MENIINKYQKCCGVCSFWEGKVVAKDSVKIEINTLNAKCSKKNQYFSYQQNYGCSDWKQKFK